MPKPTLARPVADDAPTAGHGIPAGRLLRLAEDWSGLGFWSSAVTDGQIEASDGLRRLLGLDAATPVTFALLADMARPEDRGGVAGLPTLLRDGLPVEREFRLRRPDGEVRWFGLRAEVLPPEDPVPARAVGVVRDITAQRESRRFAEQGQDRFRALMEATAAVVWIVSADGRALDMPQWQALTGQSHEAIQGLGWIEALHPADQGRTLAAWESALSHDAPYNVDYRILCADGVYRWFNARGVPVRNRDGSIREWVGVLLAIPGNNRFQMRTPDEPAVLDPSTRMVSPSQIRAARALVDLSAERLAALSGLSVSTVRRMEDAVGLIQPRSDNNLAVRRALEAQGVAFTFEPEGRPGVRHA